MSFTRFLKTVVFPACKNSKINLQDIFASLFCKRFRNVTFEEKFGTLSKMRKLTNEEKTLVLDLASAGNTLEQIRRAIKMDGRDFWRMLRNDLEFDKEFARSRQEGLEEIADSLLSIVDEYDDVQKARVKSENMRWLLSKRKPGTYGDKLDINVTQTVDIAGALLEARSRALLPDSYHSNAIEVEHTKISHETAQNAANSELVAEGNSAPKIQDGPALTLDELLGG